MLLGICSNFRLLLEDLKNYNFLHLTLNKFEGFPSFLLLLRMDEIANSKKSTKFQILIDQYLRSQSSVKKENCGKQNMVNATV